jgi:macrolide transport system ATP-binding/permease protein
MPADLWRDIRTAVRGLRAARGFASIAIVSLALGIGINTAMFSVVNAMLLRPLPVARPSQLVRVYTTSDLPESTFSYLDYRDLRRQTRAFGGVAGHALMFAMIDRGGSSQLDLGEAVTSNYFRVLGVNPLVGRTFLPEEDAAEGANRVAMISERLWRQQYGADPSITAKTIRIRGTDYSIVGVIPRAFNGMTAGLAANLWIPVSMVDDVEPVGFNDVVPSPTGTTRLTRRGSRWMFVTARLKSGVTIDQARTDSTAIMNALQREYPQTNRGRTAALRRLGDVRVHPLVDNVLTSVGAGLMMAVALVLVIACANIANMLLARGTIRSREIAIRLAIGAPRARIVRELLVESLVLAVCGGTAGALLAAWSVRLLARLQPPLPIPLSLDFGLDWRVLAFTAVASLVTGLIFGLTPAVQATKPDLVPALRNDALSGRSAGRSRLRSLLVIAQVAISVVLLAGAGLLTHSAMAAANANPGFNPNGLALATVDLRLLRYPTDRGREFYADAIERVRALPGVDSAAIVERLPFSPNIFTANVFVDGRAYPPDSHGELIDSTRVSPGYFGTLGVRLMAGRDFAATDTDTTEDVAIVNETMARRYWTNADPIGRRFRVSRADTAPVRVIGVVADHKLRTMGEEPRPLVVFARSQGYAPSATILARTAGDPRALVAELRQALLGLEPRLVFFESETMQEEMAATEFPARAGAALAAGFGVLALALAAAGLYGVVAFWVSRRTREIGVRVAVGADPARVIVMVMREGLTLVAIGLVVGGAAALIAGRALSSMLYGVGAADPLSFTGAFAVLLVAAFAATAVPARRAARLDPTIALRAN